MNKTRFSFLNLTLAVFVFSFPNFLKPYIASCEEQITITTYYPAPYGIYRELRADQMAIGSTYRTTALSNGNLIVSGNVGIGTTGPSQRLDVRGAATFLGSRLAIGDGTTMPFINTGSSGIWYSSGGASTAFFGLVNTTDAGIWLNSVGWRIVVNSAGNVGIGTTTPSAPLHVNGAANTCLYVTYHSSSGDQPCPGNTFLIFPSITIPETSGYFICCRACSDGVGVPVPDGSCDSTAWT